MLVPNGLANQGCDANAATQQVASDYQCPAATFAGCAGSTTGQQMCGSIEFGIICGGADIVQFAFEASAPNGNDDSFWIQLDDGVVDTFRKFTSNAVVACD